MRIRARSERRMPLRCSVSFGCGGGDKDIAEFCVAVQRYSEIDIYQPVGLIRLNLRLHVSFEESIALKKFVERISCFLDESSVLLTTDESVGTGFWRALGWPTKLCTGWPPAVLD